MQNLEKLIRRAKLGNASISTYRTYTQRPNVSLTNACNEVNICNIDVSYKFTYIEHLNSTGYWTFIQLILVSSYIINSDELTSSPIYFWLHSSPDLDYFIWRTNTNINWDISEWMRKHLGTTKWFQLRQASAHTLLVCFAIPKCLLRFYPKPREIKQQ